ncbi:MAG: 4-alpha-glucanotransferase [Pseudonocardia sp.]
MDEDLIDLATAHGVATGYRAEHVRIRAALGLLNDVAAEEAKAIAERRELVALLREEGLLTGDAPSEEQIVVAMHALLARSRSRLVLVSPYDVIGEERQPNLPGTVDEYPNWRLPLLISLEELRDDPRIRAVIDAVRLQRAQ